MSEHKFLILLVLSLVFALSCGNSEIKPETKPITDGGDSKLTVEIVDDGTQFTIKNVGGSVIEELQITTYPPPLSGNILLKAYSFSKNVGALEKGSIATVKRDELKNDTGDLLSISKRKVGAIRIGGKIGGQPGGEMFTAQTDKWILSPPDTKWSVVLEPILDRTEEPTRGKLNVEIGSFGVKEAPYIIENKEAYPINDLVITAFPPPKSGNVLDAKQSFSKKIGTLEKGGTATASPEEMKNEKGESLSKSQVKIGVIKVSGKVNGQEKENFANLSEKEN